MPFPHTQKNLSMQLSVYVFQNDNGECLLQGIAPYLWIVKRKLACTSLDIESTHEDLNYTIMLWILFCWKSVYAPAPSTKLTVHVSDSNSEPETYITLALKPTNIRCKLYSSTPWHSETQMMSFRLSISWIWFSMGVGLISCSAWGRGAWRRK